MPDLSIDLTFNDKYFDDDGVEHVESEKSGVIVHGYRDGEIYIEAFDVNGARTIEPRAEYSATGALRREETIRLRDYLNEVLRDA
ncbi:hypothetical protein [Microbacterium gilvum]|uniref:Uncharacterized protein n=1 Tax=Microbacterium gilvum TaxID=1336204 RepID=A0ABP9A5I2_9MICO